jgi:hypothetical protein
MDAACYHVVTTIHANAHESEGIEGTTGYVNRCSACQYVFHGYARGEGGALRAL